MKIKNGELQLFINYLDNIPLSSTEGRMRNRLKKILIEKLQQYEIDRQELVKQFSQKGENGEPLTRIDEQGVEVGDIEDMVSFNKEFVILLNEYVVIDENFSNQQMLNSIKSTVLNDRKEYFGVEADNWEIFCQIVAEINYETPTGE